MSSKEDSDPDTEGTIIIGIPSL